MTQLFLGGGIRPRKRTVGSATILHIPYASAAMTLGACACAYAYACTHFQAGTHDVVMCESAYKEQPSSTCRYLHKYSMTGVKMSFLWKKFILSYGQVDSAHPKHSPKRARMIHGTSGQEKSKVLSRVKHLFPKSAACKPIGHLVSTTL